MRRRKIRRTPTSPIKACEDSRILLRFWQYICFLQTFQMLLSPQAEEGVQIPTCTSMYKQNKSLFISRVNRSLLWFRIIVKLCDSAIFASLNRSIEACRKIWAVVYRSCVSGVKDYISFQAG